jgi:hypothetical protein
MSEHTDRPPMPMYYAGTELGTGLWCVQQYKVGGPRCSPRYVGPDAQQQAEQRATEMNAEDAQNR